MKSSKVSNAGGGRQTDKLKREKYLIRQFNMGWFGYPKYTWRNIGIVISIFGGILFISGNLIEIPLQGVSISISGFVLLACGLIITVVNG